MSQTPTTFFVTWRSTKTRAIYPVARIRHLPERGVYEFAYIHNVDKARENGFLPLVEFPDLERTYVSARLFPLLANRLMPARRPERKDFLVSLGLPADAHPMAILARTGGERQTDQIELFPVPAAQQDGCYFTHCLVRSVRYMPQASQDRIDRLHRNERLLAAGDFQNEVDPNAVLLRTADNYLVGYLPAYLTADVWQLREHCERLVVEVDRVNGPPAEAHHRLLVCVKACWPDGFVPYSTPEFQPIAAASVGV